MLHFLLVHPGGRGGGIKTFSIQTLSYRIKLQAPGQLECVHVRVRVLQHCSHFRVWSLIFLPCLLSPMALSISAWTISAWMKTITHPHTHAHTHTHTEFNIFSYSFTADVTSVTVRKKCFDLCLFFHWIQWRHFHVKLNAEGLLLHTQQTDSNIDLMTIQCC